MNIDLIMRKPVVTVTQHADLETARRRMAEHGVGSLVVVDAHGLAKGLITRADLSATQMRSRPPSLRLEARPGRHTLTDVFDAPLRRVSVDKLVQPRMMSLLETDTVLDARQMMEAHGLTHLPVLRDGKAVGIVARADLDLVIRQRAT